MEPVQTARQQYYDHTQYTATYYALYVALERWFAYTVFKNDISRIFLSSPEYAYRRRFELTDPSIAYDLVSASSLHFPFANYWPLNTGWRPDTRTAAVAATMIEGGLSAGHRKLQAMPVTLDVAVMLHFDREDDARNAYERLLWASYREQYNTTTVAWKGEVLGIPLNVRVNDLQFNPTFKEQDWLDGNRVFTVVATMLLRSYVLKPQQLNSTTNEYDSEDSYYYLTEEAILQLMRDKHLLSETVVTTALDYNPQIMINQFAVEYVRSTSVKLQWDITSDPLRTILIRLSTGEQLELDGTSNSCIFTQLIEGSDYVATATFITESGVSKSVALSFTTEAKPTDGDEAVDDRAALVGTNW